MPAQFHEFENPVLDALVGLGIHVGWELFRAAKESQQQQHERMCNQAKGGFPGPGVVTPNLVCPGDVFEMPSRCFPTPLAIPPGCQ